MESRCALCGCKTDALDLSEYTFQNGASFKLCGFCRKQLDSAVKNQAAAILWAQTLLQAQPNPESDPQARTALQAQVLSGIAEEAPLLPTPAAAIPENIAQAPQSELESIKKRLADLETAFARYKRRQLILKILSAVLPIVFVVLMLIILFASGALESLVDYYTQIRAYAEY